MVRDGEDATLPNGNHVFAAVYQEMLYQITRDYPGLPDVREMGRSEIKFWYEGLRHEIRQATKPKAE